MRQLNDNIQIGNLAQEDTFKVSDVHRNYLHGNLWPAGLTRNFLVWDVWTLTVCDLGVNVRQLSLNPLQALPSPFQNKSPLQPPYHPSSSSLKKKLQKRKHSIGDDSRGSHQCCHLMAASHMGILEQRGLREAFGKLKEKIRRLIHTDAEMKTGIFQRKASLQSSGSCVAVGIGKRW